MAPSSFRSHSRPSSMFLGLCVLPLLGGACDSKKSADTPDAKDEPAPERVELTVEAAKARLTVDGANVEMGETEVNGLRLSKLACAGVARPLLGGMAIIGALAGHKEALDACAPKGDAAVATWTSEGGLEKVEVAGASSAEADACIKAALAKVASPFPATCAAVVLVGETAGANAAAKAMLGE